MVRLFILFLFCIPLYGSGDSAPQVKMIQEFAQKPQPQTKQSELLTKLKKEEPPLRRSQVQEYGPMPFHGETKRLSKIHRDFNIYNFERIDEELQNLREDNIFLNDQINQLRERGEIYAEALEQLIKRSERYDNFFRNWDQMEELLSSGGIFGGGGLGALLLGFFGLRLKKRYRKKNSRKEDKEQEDKNNE